ncbi:MAG: hypothetical protein JW891_05230 [Candidatus Lokiarchaeota archaeon]|nr:hypothetical protein [Candidatus Lokiarchaeota archaeon]
MFQGPEQVFQFRCLFKLNFVNVAIFYNWAISSKEIIRTQVIEYGSVLDVWIILGNLLRKYLAHIEIPVTFISNKGSSKVNGEKFFVLPESFEEFYSNFEIKEAGMEGVVSIVPGERRSFPLGPSERISYGGILVSDQIHYLEDNSEFSNRLIKYDLNFLRNSIDLDLSRSNIQFNEKWRTQIQILRQHITQNLPNCLDAYIEFLNEKNVKTNEIVKNVRETFLKGINNFDDARVKNIVKKYFNFRLLTKDGLVFKKYDDLIKTKNNVKILTFSDDNKDGNLKPYSCIKLYFGQQRKKGIIKIFTQILTILGIVNKKNILFLVDISVIDVLESEFEEVKIKWTYSNFQELLDLKSYQ